MNHSIFKGLPYTSFLGGLNINIGRLKIDDNLETNLFLEPQTAIYKWLFQLDDSQSLHRKCLFHKTSIYKWLFGVPGFCAV